MDLNGYEFNGIGSLEEYFAYDIDEYYESIQMGLPALYYLGRENPPHPEIWINYFLRMVQLYSKKYATFSLVQTKQMWKEVFLILKQKRKSFFWFLSKSINESVRW